MALAGFAGVIHDRRAGGGADEGRKKSVPPVNRCLGSRAFSQYLSRRILAGMNDEVTGTVRGNTIALDEPVPPLEGRRVRVILEPLPVEDINLTSEEQEHI